MTRQELLQLVESLPEGELDAAGRYLEFLAFGQSDSAWESPEYCRYAVEQVTAAEQQVREGRTFSVEELQQRYLS